MQVELRKGNEVKVLEVSSLYDILGLDFDEVRLYGKDITSFIKGDDEDSLLACALAMVNFFKLVQGDEVLVSKWQGRIVDFIKEMRKERGYLFLCELFIVHLAGLFFFDMLSFLDEKDGKSFLDLVMQLKDYLKKK